MLFLLLHHQSCQQFLNVTVNFKGLKEKQVEILFLYVYNLRSNFVSKCVSCIQLKHGQSINCMSDKHRSQTFLSAILNCHIIKYIACLHSPFLSNSFSWQMKLRQSYLRPVSTQENNPRIGSEQNLTCTCAFGANSLPSLKQFCTCEPPTSN